MAWIEAELIHNIIPNSRRATIISNIRSIVEWLGDSTALVLVWSVQRRFAA
jgi:hypothetical protein